MTMHQAVAAPTAASALITHLAGHAGSIAQRHGVEVDIHTELESDLPLRLTSSLWDALCSVVDNAIEHGFSRSARPATKPPAGQLRLSVWQESGETFVEIADDGPGVDWDDIRTRCVEQGIPFSGPSAVFEFGVGSRLPLIRRFILGLGGSCSIDSSPGQGTRFQARFRS